MSHSEMIHFRVTAGEAQSIRERAKAANKSVSVFLRQCIQPPTSAPVCDHCETVRKCAEEWLEFTRDLPVSHNLSWTVEKYRAAVRRLLPPTPPPAANSVSEMTSRAEHYFS